MIEEPRNSSYVVMLPTPGVEADASNVQLSLLGLFPPTVVTVQGFGDTESLPVSVGGGGGGGGGEAPAWLTLTLALPPGPLTVNEPPRPEPVFPRTFTTMVALPDPAAPPPGMFIH